LIIVEPILRRITDRISVDGVGKARQNRALRARASIFEINNTIT